MDGQTKERKKNNFAYCKNCKKQVNPVRFIKNELYNRMWAITIISSLGFALPIFIIFHHFVKKKIYCERCYSRVKFYDSLDKIPGTKEQVVRIVDSINGNGKQPIYCRYCHGEIDFNTDVCPTCGAPLNNIVFVKE